MRKTMRMQANCPIECSFSENCKKVQTTHICTNPRNQTKTSTYTRSCTCQQTQKHANTQHRNYQTNKYTLHYTNTHIHNYRTHYTHESNRTLTHIYIYITLTHSRARMRTRACPQQACKSFKRTYTDIRMPNLHCTRAYNAPELLPRLDVPCHANFATRETNTVQFGKTAIAAGSCALP